MIIVSLVIAAVIAISFSAFAFIKNGEKEIEAFRQLRIQERKSMLKSLVSNGMVVVEKNYHNARDKKVITKLYREKLKNIIDVAYSMVDYAYKMPGFNEQQRKAFAKSALGSVRYEGDNYIWVNDNRPFMIMHPIKPALNGTDLSAFKDPAGKKLFVEMVKAVQADGQGTVDYLWPKPGFDEPVPKLSYVKLFKPWGWILGTGVYMETAEQEIKEKTLSILNTFRYGENNENYFYTFDTQSNKIIQHLSKAVIGGSIEDKKFKDVNGVSFLLSQKRLAMEKGEGFTEYMWPKPGEKDPKPKLAFVKYFKEWNWVVATGIYIDDIDRDVAAKRQEISSEIQSQVFELSLIILVLLIITVLVSNYLIGKSITKPLNRTIYILKDVAEGDGDLTQRLVSKSNDETAVMAHWFNLFVEHLAEIITLIQKDARDLTSLADSLNDVSESLMKGSNSMKDNSGSVFKTTEDVAVQINTIAAAAEQMNTNIANIAGTSRDISSNMNSVVESIEELSRSIQGITETAKDGMKISEQAREYANEATQAVQTLDGAAKEIDQVTLLIKKIAEQTNLLALNATIEAASAGEAGKGFAVVANEIKELANQSAGAAENIAEKISVMQGTTDQTVQIIEQVAGITHKISGAIETISEAVDTQNQVAGNITASVEQTGLSVQGMTTSIAEVSKGASEMSESASSVAGSTDTLKENFQEVDFNAQETLEGSGLVKKTSDDMKVKLQDFKNIVSRFKV